MSDSKRNDTMLWTGITSQSFVAQTEKKELAKEEKLEKRAQLQPYEEIILTEIAKLRKEISLELGNLINADTSKTDIKSIVIGLRLADSKLLSLKTRLANISRNTKKELDDETEL